MTQHAPTRGEAFHRDEIRFCRPESLLLDSFRLWSQNPENLTYIRRRLCSEIGTAAGERAAKAMKLLAHILGLQTRRTFYLMRPGSLRVTADERTLIAMIGALLHDRRPHANAMAALILPTMCHGTVLALAGELGRAFKMGGLVIAPPRESCQPQQEMIEIRAVA